MILLEVWEVDPGLLTTAFDEKFNQFEEEEVCEADSKPVEELLLFQVSYNWSNLFLNSTPDLLGLASSSAYDIPT